MATWLKDTPMHEDDVKKDTSSELTQKLPEVQHLAKSGKLLEACELLFTVEKTARLANDVPTLKNTASALLDLCVEAKNWEALNAQITLLCKRRQQKPQVITLAVQDGAKIVDLAPDDKTKVALITTLRAVSDGKIFVEKERALLTKRLADIKEKNGQIADAADILQEVHVETYGAMTRLEKCEFILEQVRLTLAKKDYVRAAIVAKKIVKKTLDEAEFQQCRLKYYKLMIEYHTHENDTLELARDWHAIYTTPIVQQDRAQYIEALEHIVIFLILSRHDNHQHDLLHRVYQEKKLLETTDYYNLLTLFATPEVVPYPLPQDITLRKHSDFTTGERAKEWFALVHTRVIEHRLCKYSNGVKTAMSRNEVRAAIQGQFVKYCAAQNIRIVSGYYTRVKMGHLANLLGLSEAETEKHLSSLVSGAVVHAKIDRPAGIISFAKTQTPEEQLSVWAGDISELLNLVETTCHLVNKENMIHKVQT